MKKKHVTYAEYANTIEAMNHRISSVMRTTEDIIDDLRRQNSNTSKQLARLERIVRYAKDDKPTYYREGCMLYIYIDKEEYSIELRELSRYSEVAEGSEDFSVSKDGFAYFDIASFDLCPFGSSSWYKYKFIIDYKKGTYLVTTRKDEERNAAEEEK